MLGKLIKYDFKALAKNLFPVYGVMIGLMLVFSLLIKLNLEDSFIFVISTIMLFFLLGSSFMITLVCVVGRFYKGLLKDEGYLSFALPVDTQTHIGAKVINAIIWSLMNIAALAICLAIYVFTVGTLKDIAEVFKMIFSIDLNFVLSILQVLLLLAVELLCGICLCFAALSIAHLFQKHQKLLAALFFLLMAIIRGMIMPTHFYGEFNSFSNTLFISPIWYVIPAALSALYAAVTWYILDKKLNLQ